MFLSHLFSVDGFYLGGLGQSWRSWADFQIFNCVKLSFMLEKIRNHEHINYFLIYALSFLTYGTHISGLGPFIPYLSAETGIIETEYSYLFSCRSFAMVAGALLVKEFQKRGFSSHNTIILGSLIMAVFSCLFSYTRSELWLGIWISIASVAYTFVEIPVNVGLLLVTNPAEVEFWMLLAHGVFGVGGLIGPFIIYFFEDSGFAVMGLLTAASIPFYFKVKSPELNGFQQEHVSSPKMKAKTISTTLEYCLCVLMFLYLGMECTFGGWISSYAVLSGVADNKGATIFPSIFWILMTVFRLAFAFLPGSSSQKLKVLIMANVLSGVISLLIVEAGYTVVACYLSGAMFGLSMSSIYPLILTFPIEAGLNIENSQTTNIVMAGVISEGILTMLVGWLMNWIHINMFFYSLTFFALSMWFIRLYCLHLIQQQKDSLRDSELGIELQETTPQE